jgi:hypothetical protein
MGAVVAGQGPRAVRIRLSGAGDDRVVRLIADGETRREWTGVNGNAVLGEELPAGGAGFVRAEVWTADGRPLAFTNPVYFDADGGFRRGTR